MKAEDYLIELDKAKEQQDIGKLLGKAISDKAVSPDVYATMCYTALNKGFKFVNIQLP